MTVPSLLILGNDAVLAAPATPVQLAHACVAAGYHAVIPASWGDELIAAHALERLRDADAPLVLCSCPRVAERLSAHSDCIAPMLLSCAAPPVATAEYLRALYAPNRPHITFAGGCPGASHGSIDVWLTAEALLGALADRGIDLSAQPTEFDSVLPPDRRRFYSEPGGVPALSALRRLPSDVALHELGPDDLVTEIAQRLLSGSRALLDIAPALGCSCSGAIGTLEPEIARARVRELEPPRALAPVVDHAVAIDLASALPVASSQFVASKDPPSPQSTSSPAVSAPSTPRESTPSSDPVSPAALPSVSPHSESGPESVVAVASLQRRSLQGLSRPVLGTMPQTRTEPGRQLPRAYVARRRSTPRGVRGSGVRSALPRTAAGSWGRRAMWVVVATTGVAAGLVLAWLLGFTA